MGKDIAGKDIARKDIMVPCDDGLVNIRVGAVIMKNGKILMVGNNREVDRLGFIHENLFYGKSPAKQNKLVYEISFYFFMKVPEDFTPHNQSITENGDKEFVKWIDPNTEENYFPKFFRTELQNPGPGVRHIITDDRETTYFN